MFLINLILLVSATFIAVFWLDKPLFTFVNYHNLYESSGLAGIERLFPWLTTEYFILTIALIAFIICIRNYYKLQTGKMYLLLIYLITSLVLTIKLKVVMNLLFGRCSPKTVISNLCALNNGSFGFNGFSLLGGFAGFPSGHCTILAFCATWIIYAKPKISIFIWGIMLVLICSLILTNYHFLSDCLGGCTLGYICGVISIKLWGSLSRVYLRYTT